MRIINEETLKQYSRSHQERIPVIEAANVGVKYNLGQKRDDIQSLSYRLISRERWRYKEFWALKGLNFTGYNGDILGIIGANGAGKTTLCRVISGILKPDTGSIAINGSVTALFSLGTGFNQQLTGRENIFLNGYMLGFSHKEINQLLPQIISFTGLGRFIDEPLKRYSSGMRARLGFSIAAMLEPEIMVIDEALSAGDLAFSEKAAQKMHELVARARMVVIVSHQTDFIEKHCNRAFWIDQGTLRACGKPGEVVAAYKESVPAWQRKKRRKVELVKTKTTISSERVITVQGVGVKFLLSKKVNSSPGIINSSGKGIFWALKDLSFTVNAGEIVGIIGANGAGKTTLCRVLTGILKPDTGAVNIKGSTTALLSFGTGFNSQLSGRNNILLNGLMLGIPRKKLINMIDDIVNFSELNEFIDRPVKEYSSGMKSRLGFSIAATIKPDIFIIDEALNAGDASFYEKASARIREMIHEAKAVVVVTHSFDFVTKICTRAIWINKGMVAYDGTPGDAIAKYKESISRPNKTKI